MNSLNLITHPRRYTVVASDAQRSVYVAAAGYALAILPIATFCSYVVCSIGFLITSIVIWKGNFNKPTVLLEIVVTIEGIICGFHVIIQSLAALLILYPITLGLFLILSRIEIYKLAKPLNEALTREFTAD